MPRPLWRGYFNKQKCPALRITVSGSREISECEAVLDTGFTGFLSVPLRQAELAGLEPHATTLMRYADGATLSKHVARGTVKIGQEAKTGLIIIEPESDELLLGMGFLRLFNRALIVSRLAVALVDEVEWANLVSGAPSTS